MRDGIIIADTNETAARLQKKVVDHIERKPKKTEDEIRQEIGWCEKMLLRTMRDDAEGYYRRHWLLFDSLEIYCDVKGTYYCGPKKALRLMEQTDEEAFRIYAKALKSFKREHLSEWISYLKRISSK